MSIFHKVYKSPVVLGLIVLLLAISAGAFVFFRSGTPDAYYGFPKPHFSKGLNLVFIADSYPSRSEFETDISLIRDALKEAEPWRSYERYNFYEIFPYRADFCGVQTENFRHPTLVCDDGKINKYLTKIKTDGPYKLVVLSRQSFESWATVSRIANSGIFFSLPPNAAGDGYSYHVQFLHLFGHAFGLKDEELFAIAKAGSPDTKPDGPNCAPDKATAKDWWGDLVASSTGVGYFKGCVGNKEYIKPTDGSLMNMNELSKLTFSYGPVSERYLRKILDYCFSNKASTASNDPAFFAQYPEFGICASGK